MGFKITLLKDTEIEIYNDVLWQSFRNSPQSLSRCLYPGGFTEPIQAYLRKSAQDSLSDSSHFSVVVWDGETGEPQAVACWYFQNTDLTLEQILEKEEKARKERSEQESIPGINFAAFGELREIQAKLMQEILGGKAHALLKVLATHPAAQRKGAGAAALNWGLQKADEMGVPAYLEASTMGRPLYAKFGFKDICAVPFDAQLHGNPTKAEHWCMLRDAKS